jgi:hypothetical protein
MKAAIVIPFLVVAFSSMAALQQPSPPSLEAVILTKQPILLGPANNALQSVTIECASMTNVTQTVIYVATNSTTSPSFICTNTFTGNISVINDLPWTRIYLFGQSVGSNGVVSAITYEGSYNGWGKWPLLAIQIPTNSMTCDYRRATKLPDMRQFFRVAYGKYDGDLFQIAHYQKLKQQVP